MLSKKQSTEKVLLKRFHLLCSVLGAKKEALAVGGGKGLKGALGGQKQLLVGARSVAAQDLFNLAPQGARWD